MKRIINRKRYDTDTAKKCGVWSNGCGIKDFQWCQETLYQKKTGEFFLHGEGGPMSRYAEAEGLNSWSGGERLMPLSWEEAEKWAEEHLTGDEYESIFGEVTEDDSKMITSFYLSVSTSEKLKRMARQFGCTQSEMITDLIERFAVDITPVDQATPPEFPGAESFKASHNEFLAWEQSEEGQKFLKEHLPPEVWEREYGNKKDGE